MPTAKQSPPPRPCSPQGSPPSATVQQCVPLLPQPPGSSPDLRGAELGPTGHWLFPRRAPECWKSHLQAGGRGPVSLSHPTPGDTLLARLGLLVPGPVPCQARLKHVLICLIWVFLGLPLSGGLGAVRESKGMEQSPGQLHECPLLTQRLCCSSCSSPSSPTTLCGSGSSHPSADAGCPTCTTPALPSAPLPLT